jgi:hypothetical protein
MKYVKPEVGQYVAHIVYQIPNKIVLDGRRMISPRFDTLYGMIYWLNFQKVNMEYTIYNTINDTIITEGYKKHNETLKGFV